MYCGSLIILKSGLRLGMRSKYRIFNLLIVAGLLFGVQFADAYAAKVDKYKFRTPVLHVDHTDRHSFSDVNLTVTFIDAIAPDGSKQNVVQKITRFPQADNYINPETKQHYTVDKVRIAGTFTMTNRNYHEDSPVATVHVDYKIKLDELYHAPLRVTLEANVTNVTAPSYRKAPAEIHTDFWVGTRDLAAIYFSFDRYTMGQLFSRTIAP